MVKVKYFGMMAEVANCAEENHTLITGDLSDLLKELNSKYSLNRFPVKIAVNREIVELDGEIKLQDNDEVAILPPFSGG